MKIVVLSEQSVIDGVVRARGETVRVPDNWTRNVRREIQRVDVPQIEQARSSEIAAIGEAEQARDEKEKAQPKSLTVKMDGAGKVSVEPEQKEYAFGDTVVLTALPDDEKTGAFLTWQIQIPNTKPQPNKNNPLKIAMVADTTIVAVFGKEVAPIEVQPAEGKLTGVKPDAASK